MKKTRLPNLSGSFVRSSLLFSGVIASSLLISGCASTNNVDPTATVNTGLGIGKTVFQTAVNNRCRSELNNHQLWNIAKVVYSESKQQQIQSTIVTKWWSLRFLIQSMLAIVILLRV